MTDNKLTNNEIIKALEERIKELKEDYKRLQLLNAPMDCFEKSHIDNIRILSSVLDLINRLQAEIEHIDNESSALLADIDFRENEINRLQAENERLIDDNKFLQDNRWKELSFVKAEAYKEFAEKMEERIAVKILKGKSNEYANGFVDALDGVNGEIDNLLKELAGDK